MLKLFKNLKKREIIFMIISVFFILLQIWLDLKLPDYMSQITVIIETQGGDVASVVKAGMNMLACALGSALTSVVVGYCSSRIGPGFAYTLRKKIMKKVISLGNGEINKFSTASLITRTTNDVNQVQMVITMGLQLVIKAPIMAVWAIMKIVGKSWELSLLTAAAVVILIIGICLINIFVVPKFKIIQKKIDALNRIMRENLSGLRVIRAFNAQDYQTEKFNAASEELMGIQLFTSRMFAFLSPVMSFVMSGLALAIYWVGAILINAMDVTERIGFFGDLVVFSSYATYVIMAFMMLAAIFMFLPRAMVSAGRINELLDCEAAVVEGSETEGSSVGEVEFKNVSFAYPNAACNSLSNISFKAHKGDTVAFIGATGSGKTTLVNLAARLYDATEGTVLIDGRDVREYSFEALYNKIGYIPQKAVLFNASVAENITFGECGFEQTLEDAQKAANIAQATQFISEMPGGMDAEIARGGMNVSGGQKQRLSIARAVARKPEILIFDDSFSALDFKTESELRRRLREELGETTCLVVAQRVGTIRDADLIVVLDDGDAVGIGTHDELMKSCEIYREIALSQLSEEELSNEGGAM